MRAQNKYGCISYSKGRICYARGRGRKDKCCRAGTVTGTAALIMRLARRLVIFAGRYVMPGVTSVRTRRNTAVHRT